MKPSPERSGDRAPLLQHFPAKRPPRFQLLFSSVRPFYFLTFNTHERLKLLARKEIHQAYCSFCLRAETYDVAVGRYVIMPDHVHLFVAMPAIGITLSEWVHTLRTVLGKQLLRLGVQKPHWQEGFFDHVLRSAESYAQKWEYVRMNPVRAGLVMNPDEWPYQGEIVCIPFD
ncbi:MAG: transposase [Verrucomicrobiaceae bacterium]|nr:transposase [Verrucomicrobiaceae bacterium]